MTNFEKLLSLNVNDKTEKRKQGSTELTYLSWSFAWAEFKKVYEDAFYEVIKNPQGLPYFHDDSGAICYTKVTAGGITHEMWLPVMDGANNAMKKEPYTYQVKEYVWDNAKRKNVPTGNMIDKKVEAYTMFDINKTVMRCLTKNLAMFGLGLYIYAGEDLPEPNKEDVDNKVLEIESLISQSGTDREKFLQYFKVDTIEKLPYDKAIQALQAKMAKAS